MLAHRAEADASTAEVRTDAPLVSYRAVRTLNAENPRYKLTGWMEARTEFDRSTGLRFEITGEGGSGHIRNKVLRKVLEGERDAIADGEGARAGLTAENYSFGAAEAAGPGLVRIRLTPRRKDRLLVDGHMIVTADDHDLVRVEGRLARNPSLWTRHVRVVRTYGRIDGVRVPLSTTSTASVLIAGDSTFTMGYEYQQINGNPVTVGTSAPAGHGSETRPR